MPKFELNKFSVIDTSDLTDTVTISTILEGVEGATRAFVEDSTENYVIEDNQDIQDTIVYDFTALGVRGSSSDQTELEGYGTTDLVLAGYSYNTFFQADDCKLQFRHTGKDRRAWMFKTRKTGGTDFDSAGKLETGFMMSENGLNMYNWQEGSTSGIAAGWTKTGGTTAWDSVNEEQDFSTTAASTLYLYREVYVPHLAGKQLTFSINVRAVTSTTGLFIEILEQDSSGSTIGSPTQFAFGTTGKKSVSVTLASNVHTIRTRVRIGQNDSVSFDEPQLSIGTSTTYIPR